MAPLERCQERTGGLRSLSVTATAPGTTDMKMLICSLLAVLAAPLPSGAQDAAAEVVDLSALEVDELLERLSPLGREGRWDEVQQTWVTEPVVAELTRRIEECEPLTDAQWARALVRSGAVRMRSRWPEDRPLAVSMRVPRWLGVSQIRMQPRLAGLEPAEAGMLVSSSCGTYSSWVRQAALYQELGTLLPGPQHVAFDITVERGRSWHRRSPAAPQPGVLWSGALAFDVEIVPSIDDAVPPARGAHLDRAVHDSIGVSFSTWWIDERNQRTAILVLDPDVAGHPALASTALSLDVELVHQGRVVQEVRLRATAYDPLALGNSVNEAEPRTIAFCTLRELPVACETDFAARAGWTLRVRGTSEGVHAIWEAETRWDGSLEIPISEAIEHDAERAGPQGRGPWMWSPTWR
jgi:hypothetical protein